MKKLIAILLCMVCVLSMAIPALAAENEDTRQTVVSLELDPSLEHYTLTIPATITIDPTEKSATLNVTLEDVNLVWHKSLYVYAVPTNHDTVNGGSYLVNTEDATKKIHYTLESNTGQILGDTDEKLGTAHFGYYEYKVGEWEEYFEQGWIELVVDGEYPGAGTYTDTLTFTVEMSYLP